MKLYFHNIAKQLLSTFSTHLHSADFLKQARHADHAQAFTRKRKLPLPALVAVLLSGMRKSAQAELDEFFGHIEQQAGLLRHVSERAFFGARAKLAATALPSAPESRDAADFECPATPQTVRLVRHVASTGKVRVLMTNLHAVYAPH